jgi:hypothetical protein
VHLRRVTRLAVLAAITTAACSDATGYRLRTAFDPEQSSFTPATVAHFIGFPLYWAGERFERWPLIAINGPDGSDRVVTFVYGDCRPAGGEEASCSPPVQIQVTPLCQHLVELTADPIWRRRRLRGAPVGTIDSAPVLFTARTQVKVYAGAMDDPDRPLRVLRALRSANHVAPVIAASGPIPAPAPGTLDLSRPCH